LKHIWVKLIAIILKGSGFYLMGNSYREHKKDKENQELVIEKG